jgi:hypothetical protein
MGNEEFIVPEYWYIQVDEDNKKLIQQWRKDNFNLTNDIELNECVYSWDRATLVRPKGGWWLCVLLTTEQFKTYVLKIQPETTPIIKDDSFEYLIKLLKEII